MYANDTPPVTTTPRRLNETHDASLKSFVASANELSTDFPLQNLPLAMFRRRGSADAFRVGVGIGDQVLDIFAVREWLEAPARMAASACAEASMTGLMAAGPLHWSALRLGLSRLLRAGSPHEAQVCPHLVAMADAEFTLAAKVPNFSDYVASMHHISKVIKAKRPEAPELPPNYVWIPLAYHGRASTIRASGHQFRRPRGQVGAFEGGRPVFGPTRLLDYEAEVGAIIGRNTNDGEALSVDQAEAAIFGLCVLNDWTARDIQGWEQFPLGPFQSKSFATTVSPWVVSMEALEPFRVPFERSADCPAPLPYLDSDNLRARGVIDVQLDILLRSQRMAAQGTQPLRVGHSHLTDCYWSLSQLVAQQTANGCSLEAGDLIGTGTVSGPQQQESGCMFELTYGGKSAIELPSGEIRHDVGDGDTVTVTAYCEAPGWRRIGFGAAIATVLPSA